MNDIKKFLLIEASKLANDSVIIDTWEADTASKILETYEKRKAWCDAHEEEYSMRTAFMFRRVVVYHFSQDVSTWVSSLEEIKELADAEKAKA